MSEFGEFAAALATVLCLSWALFWLALLAGWAYAGEDPDEEETDDV